MGPTIDQALARLARPFDTAGHRGRRAGSVQPRSRRPGATARVLAGGMATVVAMLLLSASPVGATSTAWAGCLSGTPDSETAPSGPASASVSGASASANDLAQTMAGSAGSGGGNECNATADLLTTLTVLPGTSGNEDGDPVTLRFSVDVDGSATASAGVSTTEDYPAGYADIGLGYYVKTAPTGGTTLVRFTASAGVDADWSPSFGSNISASSSVVYYNVGTGEEHQQYDRLDGSVDSVGDLGVDNHIDFATVVGAELTLEADLSVQAGGSSGAAGSGAISLRGSTFAPSPVCDCDGLELVIGPVTPPSPAISINDVSVTEGDAGTATLTFDVTLSAASADTVTVDWATADGTATTADSDYVSGGGTLTFAANDTVEHVEVTVNGDTAVEADEALTVALSNPSGATIADGSSTGTITNDDLRTISIGDTSVTEGDSGTTALDLTVTLSHASADTVTVDFATSDGTASAGADYAAASGTVTFAAGDTSQTVTVTVDGDTAVEEDETFAVGLSNPSGATIADGSGTGTILDDDVPTATIDDPSVTEGDSGTTLLTFTVSLSDFNPDGASFDWTTSDGTATAGTDYAAGSGTLDFARDEKALGINVVVNGDTDPEDDETLVVTLSNPVGATIADESGSGTIVDDDQVPTISVDDVAHDEGDSGSKTFAFTASLSNASDEAISVDWTTVDGSATAGSDFGAGGGTLTFAPGDLAASVDVTVTGDAVHEEDETFRVELSDASGATIDDGSGTGTIHNDDPRPSLAIDDVSAREGDSGTQAFDFTVSLVGQSDRTVAVDWATEDDSATSGSDYATSGDRLTFDPGETSKTASVTVNGDIDPENDETFRVLLSSASGADIGDGTGRGTIVDDDTPLPQLDIDDVSRREGDSGTKAFDFAVSLSAPSAREVTVRWATSDGSASAGPDYVADGGRLTFAPGVTSRPVTVQVKGDTAFEEDETFRVELSDASGATIVDDRGRGTIVNDDTPPVIVMRPDPWPEGTAGSGEPTTIERSQALILTRNNRSIRADADIRVAWETIDGTAIAGEDYVAAQGVATIRAGEGETLILYGVYADAKPEDDETFLLRLRIVDGPATLAEDRVPITIVNDDVRYHVGWSTSDQEVLEGNAGLTNVRLRLGVGDGPVAVPLTIWWETVESKGGKAATPGEDYERAHGSVVIGLGESSASVNVKVIGDEWAEKFEEFIVRITRVEGAVSAITSPDTVVVIGNDDTNLRR